MRDQLTPQTKEKRPSALFYLIVLAISGFLSWIVIREVEFSPVFIRAIAVPVVLVTFLYGLRKPEFPFYVLVFYIPFSSVLPGAFLTALNITNVLIGIVLICWMVGGGEGRRAESSALNGIILLFCVQNIFSIFQVMFQGMSNIAEVLALLKRWLTPFFLYYIALNFIKDRQTIKMTVMIMMLVLVSVGLMMINLSTIAEFSADALLFNKSRAGGIFEQPNSMGAFFVYYMFLFLGFFYVNWDKFKYWGMLIPFLICFDGINATFSRGAYIAFAFGLLGITFFKNKVLTFLLCFCMLIAFLNPRILPGNLQFAIDRTINYSQVYNSSGEDLDPSAGIRFEIWKGALQIIKDHWLFGVGFAQFPRHIAYYVPGLGEKDAHNTYIIIASEMGIFSLLVFLIILFMIISRTYWVYRNVDDRLFKAIALGFLGGIFGVLMANMFGSRLNSGAISAYFWILTGIIVKIHNMKKRGEIQ